MIKILNLLSIDILIKLSVANRKIFGLYGNSREIAAIVRYNSSFYIKFYVESYTEQTTSPREYLFFDSLYFTLITSHFYWNKWVIGRRGLLLELWGASRF